MSKYRQTENKTGGYNFHLTDKMITFKLKCIAETKKISVQKLLNQIVKKYVDNNFKLDIKNDDNELREDDDNE